MCKRIFGILVFVLILILTSIPVFAHNFSTTEELDILVTIPEETNFVEPLSIETIETVSAATEEYYVETVEETQTTYVEKFPEVPHIFQTDYPHVNYGGHGTVATHGCGIASLSMVLSYLLDEEILPDYLAEKYGQHNTECGSSWTLFTASAKDFNVTIEKQTWQWPDVVAALENGQVVIANANKDSVFTDGGHFIVFYGITEDGKVLVKDPNRYNYGQWSSNILKEGFANGFDQKYVKYNCFPCWIYAPKDIEALAAQKEGEI